MESDLQWYDDEDPGYMRPMGRADKVWIGICLLMIIGIFLGIFLSATG